ncbi:MAG: TatD family hydrolase [Gammaproteobacteria bacterium]|nr:TatD family hydrolase [Gammaproteobacteria bacterium]
MNTKRNKILLVDTHCHFDFSDFDSDRDQLLSDAKQKGLLHLVIPGVKRENWRRVRELAIAHEELHFALGLHPMFMDAHTEQHLRDLEIEVTKGPVVAVGEIGLDFQFGRDNQHEQERLFNSQIQIAMNANLPVIIHCRKAHEDILKILSDNNYHNGGVIHAYNGDLNQAKRYAAHGFKLGVGGAITYERATKIRKMVSELSLEQIVLETDAPDMSPVTCQGKRNTPVHIFDNFSSLVELREESAEQIAQQTTTNALEVFRLS